MKPVLSTHDLAIGFRESGRNKILHQNITLDLMPGELSCILGPNGAGKSTLIKTLAGFNKPLNGLVKLYDFDVGSASYRELSHLLSIVLTDRVSVLHSRVFDIVSLGRYPHTSLFARLSKADYTQIQKAMEYVGISHMRNRLFDHLSDGEKQKVLIAKGLAQDTPVIMLDEPTAFLDFPSKIEVMQILLDLSKTAGKAVVLSTHDVELALQVADRIWLMDKGKDIVSGCPEDLVLSNELNRFFEKQNIFFDVSSGTFRLKAMHKHKIALEQTHWKSIWIKRALERVGYRIVAAKQGISKVTTDESLNILLLSPTGKEHVFKDIESLINFLKGQR
ncbi:MAG: ABC transporter ATP-binding protein [Bacteroidota bacterium]